MNEPSIAPDCAKRCYMARQAAANMNEAAMLSHLLKRVIALHEKRPAYARHNGRRVPTGDYYCAECIEDAVTHASWPCATIRALGITQ